MLLCALLMFSACSSGGSYNSAKFAPLPPGSHNTMAYNNITTAAAAQKIEPAAGFSRLSAHQKHWGTAVQEKAVLAARQPGPVDCSVRDRFDRGALFAYEFGTQERNRVSFDVDGLNMTSTEVEAVKVNFTYRLQADKPKKDRCRYGSRYQGLVGSGYNELILRDSGRTVWHEIHDVRNEFEDRLGI